MHKMCVINRVLLSVFVQCCITQLHYSPGSEHTIYDVLHMITHYPVSTNADGHNSAQIQN